MAFYCLTCCLAVSLGEVPPVQGVPWYGAQGLNPALGGLRKPFKAKDNERKGDRLPAHFVQGLPHPGLLVTHHFCVRSGRL